MAYEKKTWKNRQSEYPNRRTLTPVDGQENTYDVARAEGLVMEEGDAFDQEEMNDLEKRIGDGFVDSGVNVYTHTRAGAVHNFTGSGANGRALMTADVQPGDTWTVNGKPVTAYMGTEDATDSMAGQPYNGKWVTFVVEGTTLNFKGGGGLTAADRAKLIPNNIRYGVSIAKVLGELIAFDTFLGIFSQGDSTSGCAYGMSKINNDPLYFGFLGTNATYSKEVPAGKYAYCAVLGAYSTQTNDSSITYGSQTINLGKTNNYINGEITLDDPTTFRLNPGRAGSGGNERACCIIIVLSKIQE